MRRINREINIFNLSMLDVISGAMAAFLILMIVLLPYYRKEHIDYQAMINALRQQLVAAVRQAEAASASAAAELEAARAETLAARAQAAAAQTKADALERRELDVVIVLDTTTSMQDEIDGLRAQIKDLLRILKSLSKSLRVGVVAYRDNDAGYVTLPFPLTEIDAAGQATLEHFLDGLDTNGNQTWEEAVYDGLAAALAQPWRDSADGVIVVIGDARAHPGQVQATFDLATSFRARSGRYRVSTISAQVGDRYTPEQKREWNAGEADRAFFAELAQRGGGVHVPSTGPLLSGIIASIFE